MIGRDNKDPKWLTDLERELGLGDTPQTHEERVEASLLSVIKSMKFTPQGWARVRDIILRADEDTDIELFHRILRADDDDAFMLTAMVALPYSLGQTLGYADEHLEKMTTFVAASYVIAMTRGYRLGQQDMIEERPSRDE